LLPNTPDAVPPLQPFHKKTPVPRLSASKTSTAVSGHGVGVTGGIISVSQ